MKRKTYCLMTCPLISGEKRLESSVHLLWLVAVTNQALLSKLLEFTNILIP